MHLWGGQEQVLPAKSEQERKGCSARCSWGSALAQHALQPGKRWLNEYKGSVSVEAIPRIGLGVRNARG